MDSLNEYTLKKIYDDLELELIINMRRNFMHHLQEQEELGFSWEMWQHAKLRSIHEFRKANEKLVGASRPYVEDILNRQIKEVYEHRVDEGLKRLPQNLQVPGTLKPINPIVPNGDVGELGQVPPQEKNFFHVNDEKIQTLIEEVKDSTRKANSLVVRRMNDVYSEVMLRSQLAMSNGVLTLKKAIDVATREFAEKGIDAITYKNGRKVNISTYAEMVLRTANQRAKFLADGKVRSQIKRYLVTSSVHHNCCDHCLEWQGRVLIDDVFSNYSEDNLDPIDREYVDKHNPPKLSLAVKGGFLHPNCRHAILTFFPEVNEEPKALTDEQKEEAKKRYDLDMKKRLQDNKVRKLRRKKELAVDKDTKKEATEEWKRAIAERKALDVDVEPKLNASKDRPETVFDDADISLFRDIIKKEIPEHNKDNVILFRERLNHILEGHSDIKNVVDTIKETVETPDLILMDGRSENTLMFVRRFSGQTLNTVVKISTSKDRENSVITAMKIRDKRVENLINKHKTLYKDPDK